MGLGVHYFQTYPFLKHRKYNWEEISTLWFRLTVCELENGRCCKDGDFVWFSIYGWLVVYLPLSSNGIIVPNWIHIFGFLMLLKWHFVYSQHVVIITYGYLVGYLVGFSPYPSEKWCWVSESQLGWFSIPVSEWKVRIQSCSKPPTSYITYTRFYPELYLELLGFLIAEKNHMSGWCHGSSLMWWALLQIGSDLLQIYFVCLVANYPRIVSGLVHPNYKWIHPTYPIYNWGYNPLTKWAEPPSGLRLD